MLKECPDCKNKISSKADICPKCGLNLKRKRATKRNLILLAAIVLAGFIGLIETMNNDSNATGIRIENQNNQPSSPLCDSISKKINLMLNANLSRCDEKKIRMRSSVYLFAHKAVSKMEKKKVRGWQPRLE